MNSHIDTDSSFNRLITVTGQNYQHIVKAAVDAQDQKKRIHQELTGNSQSLTNEDASLVVFGSLAREEWTTGSDVDWTLLIDGQADPEHLKIAQRVEQQFQEMNFQAPGPTGVFGNLSFSHDIIHQIGGQNDSNRNTTQRILLLLESTPLAVPGDAYERVVRGILNRYFESDPSGRGGKPPRFLLNDIVRFWRTIAVDFASKQRERGGQGWGLRNAKLRLSRKLIFATGLLICFNTCEVGKRAPQTADASGTIGDHLFGQLRTTPLEVIAKACVSADDGKKISEQLFSAYDSFLGILNDSDKRDRLKKLRSEDSHSDKLFGEVRTIGHHFQESLNKLFFETSQFGELTKQYGVF
jgi:predicted nucleotidyltransferase